MHQVPACPPKFARPILSAVPTQRARRETSQKTFRYLWRFYSLLFRGFFVVFSWLFRSFPSQRDPQASSRLYEATNLSGRPSCRCLPWGVHRLMVGRGPKEKLLGGSRPGRKGPGPWSILEGLGGRCGVPGGPGLLGGVSHIQSDWGGAVGWPGHCWGRLALRQ